MTCDVPRQFVHIEADKGDALDKAGPYFLLKARPNAPIYVRNLRKTLEAGLIRHGFQLTDQPKEAVYYITYSSDKSAEKSMTYQFLPSFSSTTGEFGDQNFSSSTTSDVAVPVPTTEIYRSLFVSVYRIDRERPKKSPLVWEGSLTVEDNNEGSSEQLVESLLKRYGMNFEGMVPVDEDAPKGRAKVVSHPRS